MKQTKGIVVLVVVLVALMLFAACAKPQQAAPAESAAEPAAESAAVEEPVVEEAPAEQVAVEHDGPGTYQYTLGVVQPGPEYYYQTFADSIKAAAEYAGMTVVPLLSEYSAETEIANVEDLISQDVDAISVFSVSSETAQVDAQLCNEAGIPLFLTNSAAAEGTGKPTCMIGNSFYDMGTTNGSWVVENVPGELKILEIQGQLGQGIAEPISQGFADQIATRDDAEIVFQQTANWVRSEAITITEDALMSDLDFNMIFVHNEDMCVGVVNVLEENNMLDQVKVVTENGSDDGIQLIKDGKVLSTCANPASYVGGDVVVQVLKYFDGVEVPEKYDSPVFIIDSSNVNDPDLITWDKKWAVSRVDEYFASK